ncbi:MAG TPA: cytochrome c peroxidase [Rubrivivax sp.]|nr:cytochrome c peroxidase [Rubrivivax sp.]
MKPHLAFALWLGAWLGLGAAQPLNSPLSNDQVPRILAHGPWPPEAPRDPSNRVSGQPAAIRFGAALFGDARLSRDGSLSCASCHQPARGFSDGLPLGMGLQPLTRNTTGLKNVAVQRWFGWDGANDNLWAQSLRPLLDAREMGGSLASVAATVRHQADLREGYRRAFGTAPGADDERVAVDVAKALAAHQETLLTRRTPFDDFRDAVQRGDRKAAAAYPLAAQRGLALFVGKGRCYVCHSGPNFSNGEFSDIGVPFFIAKGQVDAGRHSGIKVLSASRYNLLGPFNDDATRASAVSTRHVLQDHRHFGEFKVPSLRNLAGTAPYMHNGSQRTLREVLRHYSELNEERLHADGERILVPLKLTPAETDDLLAFLDSLNERAAGGP